MSAPDDTPFLRYGVRLSEPAEAEVDAIYQRLFVLSPTAADRWRDGLAEAIDSLRQMPGRCALAPENGLFDRELRQFVYRQGRTVCRILFVIFEATENEPAIVHILRVRHGAQRRLGTTGQDDDNPS